MAAKYQKKQAFLKEAFHTNQQTTIQRHKCVPTCAHQHRHKHTCEHSHARTQICAHGHAQTHICAHQHARRHIFAQQQAHTNTCTTTRASQNKHRRLSFTSRYPTPSGCFPQTLLLSPRNDQLSVADPSRLRTSIECREICWRRGSIRFHAALESRVLEQRENPIFS